MVANRSTPQEDLYLVYSGRNQDSGKPIIRAHLNPLVWWIWVGVLVVIAGTLIALIPSAATARVPQPARVRIAIPATSGETVGAGR
jgi:cytochrome c-type biogenesis protein CcmF